MSRPARPAAPSRLWLRWSPELKTVAALMRPDEAEKKKGERRARRDAVPHFGALRGWEQRLADGILRTG